MAKKKKHHQSFPVKRHDVNTVGRLGGGQYVSGLPWWQYYYGVGFGGWGGYTGNDHENSESPSQEAGEHDAGSSGGESAGSGDGGGTGSM